MIPPRLVFLVLPLLTGCTQQQLLAKFVSAEDEALATHYVDSLRARQFDEIKAAIDPRLVNSLNTDVLLRMADTIPEGEPTSKKVVGAQVWTNPEGTTTNITFEYELDGKWRLVNVATLKKADSVSIVGFNVYQIQESLEQHNRFRLAGKSIEHYVVLLGVLLLPLLTIYALVTCVRTKMTGRKWPWVLFILFGVGGLTLNWTTGEWHVSLLSVRLLSASASADFYGPWMLSVSLPLGGTIFLLRRRTLQAAVR